MNRKHAAAIVLALPLLGGCESQRNAIAAELIEVADEERRFEEVIEEIEALPAPTEDDLADLALARREEANREARRRDLEKLTDAALLRRGAEGAKDLATGNWYALIMSVIGLGSAALGALGGKKLARKDGVQMLEERDKRRDESRVNQGIAAASERSAIQAESLVAKAAKDAARREAALIASQAAKAEFDALRAAAVRTPSEHLTAAPAPRTALGLANPEELQAQLSALLGEPIPNPPLN